MPRVQTLKQRKLKTLIIDNSRSPAPKPMGALMLEAGYSKSTAVQPSVILSSKVFKTFLDSLDDRPILNRWYNFALKDTDKRVALEAGKEIMKLKDRYPAGKLKLTAYQEELSEVME